MLLLYLKRTSKNTSRVCQWNIKKDYSEWLVEQLLSDNAPDIFILAEILMTLPKLEL